MKNTIAVAMLTLLSASALRSQEMHHVPGMQHEPGRTVSPEAGQGAYAAVAEVVRILDADPATDWSRVNLERLRQHLIAMDEVTMNARVRAVDVPGGSEMEVTGTGPTVAGIRDMLNAHTRQLNGMGEYQATATEIPDGVRWTVIATRPSDSRAVRRIRALAFIGLLTLDNHHASHHLAMARGEAR